MKKKLLPAGMEEFNLHTMNGKEFDVKALAQMVDCLPMMSERTLIVVNDYDIFKGTRTPWRRCCGICPTTCAWCSSTTCWNINQTPAPGWPPC